MTTPAEANTSMFSEEAAANIVEWADKAEMPNVRMIIDQIRDYLGHPEEVMKRSDSWGSAHRAITDSRRGIETARLDLRAYWEGRAADAFDGYVDHVLDSIDHVEESFKELHRGVSDLNSHMTLTYVSLIEFLHRCSNGIIEAANSLAQVG